MTTARIYKPPKSAMQAGLAKTRRWILEYDPATPREIDPLMGWTSSSDMKGQVRLFFASSEEAVAYAERKGLVYRIEPLEQPHIRRGLSYSDNFRPGRLDQWTH